MPDCKKVINTFSENSEFLTHDQRKNRWAVPYNYEALNARVENLIIGNISAVKGKKILDLGCHFGSFAYACIQHGAEFVRGIDSDINLIKQGKQFFKSKKVPAEKYRFTSSDVISFLERQKENSYDTILCLGLLYYVPDPFHMLKLMKKTAEEFIILDTFTAYYGACVFKDGQAIRKNANDEIFDLPVIFYPLTQAKKDSYKLCKSFESRTGRPLTMISLPTVKALENFFRVLQMNYSRLSWDKYIINKSYWRDFFDNDYKAKSHWADIYNSKIRVSYLLHC